MKKILVAAIQLTSTGMLNANTQPYCSQGTHKTLWATLI